MLKLLIRHVLRLFILLSFLVGAVGMASAVDVELVGVLGKKAVLVTGGGAPTTVSVGQQTRDGVRLREVSGEAAVVEVDGQLRRLVLGGAPVRMGEAPSSGGLSLLADAQGHHFVSGSINGASVRFLVDTGASMVSMGVSDARRAGIDYRRGTPGRSQTANGPAAVWKVRLDSVRVGDIALHGVDGLVHENDLPFVLLGMSFLNRMDMQRDGERLVLRRRY